MHLYPMAIISFLMKFTVIIERVEPLKRDRHRKSNYPKAL